MTTTSSVPVDPSASSSRTVSLADEEAVKQIVVQSIFGLWDIVNQLTRLRPSHQKRYRVTIFGSARVQPDSFAYREVERVARALTELGCDIVTGGGPGLMEAANAGAAAAETKDQRESMGIRVQLPFEQKVNPYVHESFEHDTFFTRLHHFVLLSNAYVVVPGGVGTLLELSMIWQLLQVRHLQGTPLILVGKMWGPLVDWAKSTMLTTEPPLANPADLEIPVCVNTGDEAIALIREDFAAWQARSGETGAVATVAE